MDLCEFQTSLATEQGPGQLGLHRETLSRETMTTTTTTKPKQTKMNTFWIKKKKTTEGGSGGARF